MPLRPPLAQLFSSSGPQSHLSPEAPGELVLPIIPPRGSLPRVTLFPILAPYHISREQSCLPFALATLHHEVSVSPAAARPPPASAHTDLQRVQALEVTTATDEPLTPTVAIFSPTPRAFTFPQHDPPPFASPSSSPFEPDLKSSRSTPPLQQRALSPASSLGSETSSLFSSPSTATSSQASHRRRRSTVSDNERRPKRGDEDYIKRPENAFILFRRKCCEDRNQAQEDPEDPAAAPVKKQRQADLSKAISQQWKGLSSEERQYWEDLAKEKKKQHEEMYPNYVYRPQRVKKTKKGKGKRQDGEEGEPGISFIMPVPSPPRSLSRGANISQGRRACSAPTPPPAFQTIQLPTVFMPSCPPSPTSVPRISRRSSYVPPPTDADPSTHFEYMPHDAILPPSFQRPHYTMVSFLLRLRVALRLTFAAAL